MLTMAGLSVWASVATGAITPKTSKAITSMGISGFMFQLLDKCTAFLRRLVNDKSFRATRPNNQCA